MTFGAQQSRSIIGEPAADALRLVGIEAKVETQTPDDGTEIKKPMADVRYLPPRHEVYVVGTPVWDTVRGGGYRDSKLVPVFRDQDKGFVVDRSDLEERRRACWTLWQRAGWGTVCVAVGVVQVVLGVLQTVLE